MTLSVPLEEKSASVQSLSASEIGLLSMVCIELAWPQQIHSGICILVRLVSQRNADWMLFMSCVTAKTRYALDVINYLQKRKRSNNADTLLTAQSQAII